MPLIVMSQARAISFFHPGLRFLCCLLFCFSNVVARNFKAPSGRSFTSAFKGEGEVQASLLDVFEVHQPVLNTSNGTFSSVEQVLMNHSFGFSYGHPFIGIYNPPSHNFSHVVFNLTVVSAGRQFDRLGILYFGDVEIFRTSTAEPTVDGIKWTYLKDMTPYLSLFKSSQKTIFDLGNLIDNTYTGAFNATLTALFLNETDGHYTPADLVVPVSARLSSSNRPSAFSLPGQNASNSIAIPQNSRRAVFTIAACGQADEEFWYTNVLDSDTLSFPSSGALLGHSPFREVQVYIDGLLAGVQWPFPVVFTGGIAPGFWRPIVGIHAFDLPEHEIDITPWLPFLRDGAEHTFEIRVAGLSAGSDNKLSISSPVGNYWVVTGKLFIWLDDSDNDASNGSLPEVIAPTPQIDVESWIQTFPNGTNKTLSYSVNVKRHILVSSLQSSPMEQQRAASWSQSLTFSNNGSIYDNGNTQDMSMLTTGTDVSPLGLYAKRYQYPLSVNSTFDIGPNNSLSIGARLDRGLDVKTFATAASSFPFELGTIGTTINSDVSGAAGTSLWPYGWTQLLTRQNGTAHYLSLPGRKTSYSWGTTEQAYSFKSVDNFFTPLLSSPALPLSNIANDLLMVPLGANGDANVDNGSDLDPDLDSVPQTYRYDRHVIASNGKVIEDEETINGQTTVQYSAPPGRIGAANVDEFADEDVNKLLGRGRSC
ncbi:hypothetical protein L228DRAFT_236652 [Xylona heveae TC161]|uniref:Peptide N-acetyl-beta-D-glucosaminyl asparaginase amidase A N-terminal domain-containing protein n=1 Tax=Xylona heveae (strain CBS 132557 / TC161) TaxID=1328760 RepID=A0A165IZ44_XYLHT|nr:hypothetical protein L228DRAFT_236652 [Xylona heveae TC161]KZF25573.1 hypothetical protein L228DRAFT_236652 [Xylona heveae TC161]